MPTLRDLRAGEMFRFTESYSWYEYRGNGWYGGLKGEDGGPWHDDTNRAVISPDHDINEQWEAHLRHITHQ